MYRLLQEVEHLEQDLARGVAAADAGRKQKQKRKRHGFGGGVKGEGGEEEEQEEKDDKDSLMGDDSKDGLGEGERGMGEAAWKLVQPLAQAAVPAWIVRMRGPCGTLYELLQRKERNTRLGMCA
jgi:hypothetical protein